MWIYLIHRNAHVNKGLLDTAGACIAHTRPAHARASGNEACRRLTPPSRRRSPCPDADLHAKCQCSGPWAGRAGVYVRFSSAAFLRQPKRANFPQSNFYSGQGLTARDKQGPTARLTLGWKERRTGVPVLSVLVVCPTGTYYGRPWWACCLAV